MAVYRPSAQAVLDPLTATATSAERGLRERAAGGDKSAAGGDHMHWHKAWNEYVRGHFVSSTAAALIQSFLLKTLAATGVTNVADAESEADKSE